ncbi:MAG: diaminopimelate epimerase [Acidobacteriaceae bacterium]
MKKPASIPFVKATACGNDFLLIDGNLAPEDPATLTRSICDRHNGVGADGVEWLYESEQPMTSDLRIRLINADGSPAEISGNGTRCVAAWLASERGLNAPRIATDAGIKTATLIRRDGHYFEFRTAMGKPVFAGEISLDLGEATVRGLELSMGNPQFVIFVDDFEHDWRTTASAASHHWHFSQGTNVELVKISGRNEIEIRIWERGAGETMSSGTGSCASAVAAIGAGKAQSPVRVVAPGGAQTVMWENDEATLTGPAQILCRGEFYL